MHRTLKIILIVGSVVFCLCIFAYMRMSDSACLEMTLRSKTGSIWALAFAPDGIRLATITSDNSVRLWDIASKCQRLLYVGKDTCSCIAFHPQKELLAVGTGNDVLLLDLQEGREVARYSAHTWPVKCIVFSPNGSLLASGGLDRTIRVWDSMTGDEVAVLIGHNSVVESLAFRDENVLASGAHDKSVRVWDLRVKQEIAYLSDSVGAIHSVCWLKDGSLMSSGIQKKVVRGSTGQLRIWSIQERACIFSTVIEKGPVMRVATTSDGMGAFLECSDAILIWSWRSRSIVRRVNAESGKVFSAMCVSADGRLLATGCVSGGNDGEVKLWKTDCLTNEL